MLGNPTVILLLVLPVEAVLLLSLAEIPYFLHVLMKSPLWGLQKFFPLTPCRVNCVCHG